MAVNLCKIRQSKDADAEFFRSVYEQKKQYQGLWVVSPEGKVLAAHIHAKRQPEWTRDVLDTLAKGLEAFGPTTPRRAYATEPLPYRGLGVRPDGGIGLASYIRYCRNGKFEGSVTRDTVILSAKQWAALLPPKVEPGAAWTLPEGVVREFSRCLSPDSDLSTMPRPDEVTACRITGKVRSAQAGVAVLSYYGELATAHKNPYDTKKVSRSNVEMVGFARYDLREGKLAALTWVFEGTYHMYPPYDTPARPFVAGLEWRLERLGN